MKYLKKHSKVRFPIRLWDLATYATREKSDIVYWQNDSVVIKDLYSQDVLQLFGMFFPTPNQENLRRIINMYQGFKKEKTDQKGFLILSHIHLKRNDRTLAEKIIMSPVEKVNKKCKHETFRKQKIMKKTMKIQNQNKTFLLQQQASILKLQSEDQTENQTKSKNQSNDESDNQSEYKNKMKQNDVFMNIENDFLEELCPIDHLQYLPRQEYQMKRIIPWKF